VPELQAAGGLVAEALGDITVDCDVLSDSDTDLKAVIYTAAPGSEDATKLDLAVVAGVRQAR
jgi:hypothetical protein